MDIRGSKPVDAGDIKRAVIDKTAKTGAIPGQQAPQKSPAADRVDISSRSREIAELMAKIEKIPDLREERIKEIREAIQAGSYEIDPRRIAEKILSEL